MYKFSKSSIFAGIFLALVFRKIFIAWITMNFVQNHADEVSFERIINDESFQDSVKLMKSNSLILILNKHALNMTFNWLCNIQKMEGVLENTVIVSLDQETHEQIESHWKNVKQIPIYVKSLQEPFNYGDGQYQLFYLLRANLARSFLHFNKSFWMIQQDTFWNDNLLNINLSEFNNTDIIFDRASESSPLVAGGYYHAKNTENSRRYFDKLAKDISHWYVPDNAYMTALCEVGGLARCGRLSFDLISNWQWLDGNLKSPPSFIQFDGETQLGGKLEKMRKIGFYFLNEDDQTTCNAKYLENTRKRLQNQNSTFSQPLSQSVKQFKFYQNLVDTFYATNIGALFMNYFALPFAHFCMLSM